MRATLRLRSWVHAARLLALAAAWLMGPSIARAQDNMLRGPHPFLKDNELEAYVMLAEGLSQSPSGTKLALEYGYKLELP